MGLKILLADDSPHAQRMGTTILSALGYEVVTVSNGAAALKRLEEDVPDLIIADTSMPGLSGFEVCQQVKKRPAWASTPVLLAHAQFEFYDAEQAKEAGADAVIQKPFEPTALEKLVHDLLAGRAKKDKAAVSAGPPAAPPAAQHEASSAAAESNTSDLGAIPAGPIPFKPAGAAEPELLIGSAALEDSVSRASEPAKRPAAEPAKPRSLELVTSKAWPEHEYHIEEQVFDDAGPTAPAVANAALLPVETVPPEEDTPTLDISAEPSDLQTFYSESDTSAGEEPPPDPQWTPGYEIPESVEAEASTPATSSLHEPELIGSKPAALDPDSFLADETVPEPGRFAAAPKSQSQANEPGDVTIESNFDVKRSGRDTDDMAWFAVAMNRPQPAETAPKHHNGDQAAPDRPRTTAAAAGAATTRSSPSSAQPEKSASDSSSQPASGENLEDVVNRVLSTYLSPNLAEQASDEIKRRLKRD